MLVAARGARLELTPEAVRHVAEYILSQADPAGGFRNRAGRPDLYYTVFGLSALIALGARLPLADVRRQRAFLAAAAHRRDLDFVHQVCLQRAARLLPAVAMPDWCRAGAESARRWFARRPPGVSRIAALEPWRTASGGYSHRTPPGAHSSVYAGFLAWQAHEDAGLWLQVTDEAGLVLAAIEGHRREDGAYMNEPGDAAGTTTATAAALVLLAQCGSPVRHATLTWLLTQAAPNGGFCAGPGTPLADMLSTATAMFAMRHAGVAISAERQAQTRRFVTDLWTPAGGFSGTVADEQPDVEYTFYALLALGCL